jgi:SAM-dependent methyltransferase
LSDAGPSETGSADVAADAASGRWFRPLADHMGDTYLRYSFTKGTGQEAGFLLDALGLAPGARLLDAGCGPGRHVRAFRRRGIDVVGLDLAESFCRSVVAGDPPAPAVAADIRSIPFPGGFDAVISLCQGGFGLLGGPGAPIDADQHALRELASVLRPGGRMAVSAFSAYFQVRFQAGDGGDFDADTGVMHERTLVKDAAGTDLDAELWTTGFTPRELRLLASGVGLEVEAIWSVEPGQYARRTPDIDHAEFLLLARKP